MSRLRLDEGIRILERTPATLDAMLRGLGPEWTGVNEGGDSWSAFDIMGHLIHGERTDWMGRARVILEHGTSRPFEPFDRFAQFRESEGRTLDELLDTFAELRTTNLDDLGALRLGEGELERTGIHPDFGQVTLRQLLSTWVVHDLGHIAQIARVMAKRYRESAGPWQAYLPILTDRT